MNFISNSFTTQGANPIVLSLIFILTGFCWKFVCTDSKFCDCLSKFGIFHIKIISKYQIKTWMFFNARILIFSRSLYFLWLKSSSKSFLRVGLLLVKFPRLMRILMSLALNISVIMPSIPVIYARKVCLLCAIVYL